MSSEAEGKKELSKNELKKLAKKAEKAAKKQQKLQGQPNASANKGGGSNGGVKTNQSIPPPPLSTSTKPFAELAGLSAESLDDARVMKVVLACQLYGVDVKAAKSTKGSSGGCGSLWKNRPTLTIHCEGQSNVVSGAGNAMAVAIAKLGCASADDDDDDDSIQRPKHDMMMSLKVDEWCEWERTVLRPACETGSSVSAKKREVAFQYLQNALEQSNGGLHILGAAAGDSVADICILSTLINSDHASSSAVVTKYLQGHAAAFERAKASIADLIESSSPSKPFVVDMNEPSLLSVLDGMFRAAVKGMIGAELAEQALPPSKQIVSNCKNTKQGDFQCSAAMTVFAALKKSGNTDYKSPQQVAAAIIESVGGSNPVVTDLQVQGPGFVLCRLQGSFLQPHVQKMLRTGNLAVKPPPKTLTCVVDFSSPNIAKEMHVGHLRSTIIGESVCRILEFNGFQVHRVNHVGDWGTQFGMLIQFLKEEYPDVGESDELPNITDLTLFYKQAKQRFDESPEFKKMSQTNVVKLQSGDAECLKIWKMLCDVSRREFQKVYKRLDVTCEEFGESFYNDKIDDVVQEFNKAGKLKVEEGGAKCVFSDKFKIPLMLQKSDGGYGYDSTDMAALKYRLKELKADRIICITDFSQGDHFKMVFEAGRDIGWLEGGQKLEHIGFGTVNGEDGKRFKTRSGETVRLVDLLDEAVSRMEKSLTDRIAEGKANITAEQVHEVAEAIGYGAVKYYDLRRNPTSNYKFSYDLMLDTKGDTAVYLLYARVRFESIMAKAEAQHGASVQDLVQQCKDGKNVVTLEHSSERNLALHLLMFADTMELTLQDLFPYHICEYCYKLAIAGTDFVTQCKVLGSPEMNSRLLLCYATAYAMNQCFELLGIREVKRI